MMNLFLIGNISGCKENVRIDALVEKRGDIKIILDFNITVSEKVDRQNKFRLLTL